MAGSTPSPFDSIYAPATPSGISERAVLRLSGPRVFVALAGILGQELPRERRRFEARWPLGPEGVDLPLALQLFPGPASYTGEDLIELHAPSSPLILSWLMEELERAGMRLASPGEFTRRAFQNGKMGLAEVEAVLALIGSRAEQDLARASAVLAGDPVLSAEGWRQELLDLLALLEAGLDFEEGETGEVAPELWRPRLETLVRDLGAVEGQLGRTALDLALPGFLLLGPPNAGKTSLWNDLLEKELEQSALGDDLARGLVSDEAGTTRDLRWLRLPSLGLRLADSPGRELWQDGGQGVGQEQRILQQALASSSGYLWLEPLRPDWRGASAGLGAAPSLSVATRADEATGRERAGLPPGVLPISLQDPGSLDKLRDCLRNLPGASTTGEAFLGMLLGRLHKARDLLRGALDQDLPELVAEELRLALALLEPEQASEVPEEILDRIFGRFCLGK